MMIVSPPTLSKGTIVLRPVRPFVRSFVRPSVCPGFSRQPFIEFLWNLAWSCNFGQLRTWHSPIFEKKNFWAKFAQKGPKNAQKWGFWDFKENLVLQCAFFPRYNESTHQDITFAKNRMSGKNLVLEIWPKTCFWVYPGKPKLVKILNYPKIGVFVLDLQLFSTLFPNFTTIFQNFHF